MTPEQRCEEECAKGFLWLLVLSVLVLCCLYGFAFARDLGQWQNNDPAISEWYRTLKQPDSNGVASCCGEGDAYWCEDPHTKTDHLGNVTNWCTITDDRPDAPRLRKHVDIGTEIEIPDRAMLHLNQGNPTGHGIVFLSPGLYVYCYAMAGGV